MPKKEPGPLALATKDVDTIKKQVSLRAYFLYLILVILKL